MEAHLIEQYFPLSPGFPPLAPLTALREGAIIIPTGRYNMRTVKEHPETKEKLLKAAQELMLTKGFPATTLDEICEKAGVTKGCFFHYFDDKEHLGKELVERAALVRREALHNAPFRKEKDPLKRVFGLLDSLIEKFKDKGSHKGCLLGTFAQELSETYPEIRSACNKGFAEWAEILKQDLDAAKAAYLPKSSLDTKSMAYYFISLLEGSFILAKVQKSTAVPYENLKMFKEYVGSVFQK